MSTRRASIASSASAASRFPWVVALIILAGCSRSRVDAILGRDCSDGDTCYRQAQALVRRNFQERSAKERSAERAARAVILFQKGCDLGKGPSCAVLGDFFEDGGLASLTCPAPPDSTKRGAC